MLLLLNKCSEKQKLRLDDRRGSRRVLVVPELLLVWLGLAQVRSTASERLHLLWMSDSHLPRAVQVLLVLPA